MTKLAEALLIGVVTILIMAVVAGLWKYATSQDKEAAFETSRIFALFIGPIGLLVLIVIYWVAKSG